MDNITDKLNALKNTSVEDITGLPHTSYLDKNTLPSIPAIYFLVVNNFIVYIGKTFDLNNRWRIHHLSQYIHSFLFATKIIEQTSCNIYYIDYSDKTQDDLVFGEGLMIRLFNPPLNYVMGEAKQPILSSVTTRTPSRQMKEKKHLIEEAEANTKEKNEEFIFRLERLSSRQVRKIIQLLNISHYSYLTKQEMIIILNYCWEQPLIKDKIESILSNFSINSTKQILIQ